MTKPYSELIIEQAKVLQLFETKAQRMQSAAAIAMTQELGRQMLVALLQALKDSNAVHRGKLERLRASSRNEDIQPIIDETAAEIDAIFGLPRSSDAPLN
jgi:hypothetical protein